MKAAVLEELKKPLVVREVPDPTIDANGVIIRVEANGVCRSDWHAWVGDVKNFQRGDRVIVPFSQGDGTCQLCQEGHHNICDNGLLVGFHYWGGYGRYAAIPNADFNLVRLPDALSFEDGASVGCRFMTSYYGVVEQAKVRPGEWVAVYGCGGIGLSAIHIANSAGANVIAVDIMPEKLEFAQKLGAAYTVNSKETDPVEAVHRLTKGGAHVSIDALGIANTILNSIKSLRKRGRHLQLGIATSENRTTPIPTDLIVTKELQIIGSLGMPAPRYPSMLQMIAAGKLNPAQLVTKRISIEEAGAEIEAMTNFNTLGVTVVNKW